MQFFWVFIMKYMVVLLSFLFVGNLLANNQLGGVREEGATGDNADRVVCQQPVRIHFTGEEVVSKTAGGGGRVVLVMDRPDFNYAASCRLFGVSLSSFLYYKVIQVLKIKGEINNDDPVVYLTSLTSKALLFTGDNCHLSELIIVAHGNDSSECLQAAKNNDTDLEDHLNPLYSPQTLACMLSYAGLKSVKNLQIVSCNIGNDNNHYIERLLEALNSWGFGTRSVSGTRGYILGVWLGVTGFMCSAGYSCNGLSKRTCFYNLGCY